ncbi:MAG: EutN/CcmL family microcompartment protein [Candidatus Schekmanbacteria bacterium]|nr:EutN/CcmL family microcompartment protein [Candidatus Schekmanbacteria bacterium]
MKVGRVIGRVVATAKDPSLVGKKLLLLQPMDGEQRPSGDPVVGVDAVGAGAGELVFYVGGKEATFPFLPQEVITDAGIVGIIDSLEPDRGAASEREREEPR